jgi:hypothetical protein
MAAIEATSERQNAAENSSYVVTHFVTEIRQRYQWQCKPLAAHTNPIGTIFDR